MTIGFNSYKQFNVERTIFSTNGAKTTGYSHAKMNLDAYCKLDIKINLKWIKDHHLIPSGCCCC